MNILSTIEKNNRQITGRLSDGSDRQVKDIITYVTTVKDGYRTYELTFDHEPTTDEINTAYENKNYTDVTPMEDKIAETQDNQLTIMEAIADVYAKLPTA